MFGVLGVLFVLKLCIVVVSWCSGCVMKLNVVRFVSRLSSVMIVIDYSVVCSMLLVLMCVVSWLCVLLSSIM